MQHLHSAKVDDYHHQLSQISMTDRNSFNDMLFISSDKRFTDLLSHLHSAVCVISDLLHAVFNVSEISFYQRAIYLDLWVICSMHQTANHSNAENPH